MSQIDKDQLEAARTAVARGVALLDEHKGPFWRKHIRKDLLDLGDAQTCILGQTFAGHFDEGTQYFAAEVPGYTPERYGFEMDQEGAYQGETSAVDWDGSNQGFGYPALGRAWEEELFPEMFEVTFATVENLIDTKLDERFERLHTELPLTIAEGIKGVFRNL